ncbi:uracil-DNA glycosylase [Hoyosella sp. G463]|uniref:Uracil-DNA glycosylase n=1 Tax=Lolliginicoccus lacisalsi TaxID=2742202 RepID=A0A927J9N8_9ACTN|nr:uracil-DNA glycosylase [Lolliginicoccus lacisalsi]MBD8505066.1 uracil-DNA glycosylase [Lolliginicoccus lacisalsi]
MRIPSAPRTLESHAVRAERAARIRDPHVEPINSLIDEIARAIGYPALPYIDPTFGGTQARALMVLKAPEADADPDKAGTRLLSIDNDDTGAANLFDAFARHGIDRTDITPWNICPFPIAGDNPTAAERREAAPYTRKLLAMLPNLKFVVTLGAAARDGWKPRLLHPYRQLTIMAGASPSPPGINRADQRSSFEAAMIQLADRLR